MTPEDVRALADRLRRWEEILRLEEEEERLKEERKRLKEERQAERLRLQAEPSPEPNWTLENSHEWLMERVDDGIGCPCCARYVKRYRRALQKHMAEWLLALHRLTIPDGDWIHTKKVFSWLSRNGGNRGSHANDYNYLVHWGLTEPSPTNKVPVDDRKKPGRTGHWRVTEAGRQFVLGNTTVPKKVVTLASVFEGFCGEPISIHEAFDDIFHYRKLMGAVSPLDMEVRSA